MNDIKIYQTLQQGGFSKEAAKEFVEALKENQDVATKADVLMLKTEIRDLEVRMSGKFEMILKEMNAMTWKFFGGLLGLGAILKLAEYLK